MQGVGSMATPWVTNGNAPGGTWTTTDHNLERQRPHGDTERPDNMSTAAVITFAIFVSAALTACIVFPLLYYYGDGPRYSVAIDSASSVLDHQAGVSFNLTLFVASTGHGAKECIHPGMYVQVLYRGIQVAASDGAETRRTCARPRNKTGLPVVARATMLPVGNVLDSLALELGQGAAVFDMKFNIPTDGKGGPGLSVRDCKGGRIGQAAVSCDSHTYTKRSK